MPERDTHLSIAEARSGTAHHVAVPAITGRVVAVNVSGGGVPKLPVHSAEVGHLGLSGDGHDDEADHGGPTRAVCLLALEAIRRVAAEGHPVAPGTTGENITTEGIELAALPIGTRLAIGAGLILELTSTVNPCRTIAHNFADGRFGRLSAKTNPMDTRMYASVVRGGTVSPGDTVSVLPAGSGD